MSKIVRIADTIIAKVASMCPGCDCQISIGQYAVIFTNGIIAHAGACTSDYYKTLGRGEAPHIPISSFE